MSGTDAPVGLWCSRGVKADLLIRGAHVVDPAAALDDDLDVLVVKGKVADIGAALSLPEGVRELDGAEKLLVPGFVDLHTHLREPGREDEEDLASGTMAAAAGGYVAVFGMANTDPVIDTAPVLESLARRAQEVAAVPVGFHASVSRGLRGEQLTEMWELGRSGAVAFSDDGQSVASAYLLRRALQYAKITGRHVAIHAEDASLTAGGVMHEGAISARLGLGGMPSVAESIDVARAVELAAYEDARVHLCHLSTAGGVEHLARARGAGLSVTAEVTPHHLTLCDDAVLTLDSNLKMNPPLRPAADRKALVAALTSGLIDCVATDHAPHSAEEKEVPFEEAPFGTTGLETAFSVLYDTLVTGGAMPLATLVERMSQAPARIAGIPMPTIAKGAPANFCLIDPHAGWSVERASFHSRSHNSAWLGKALRARVVLTVAAGRVAWEHHA